jgi:secondary thiamine-phosphate synthase enzyme
MITCEIRTRRRHEFVDITPQVQDAVRESKSANGICVVYCPHTTAAITINENYDADVKADMAMALQRLVPKDWPFNHGEGNSDSHVQTSLYGPSQSLIIDEGQLILGQWQGIFFCEFDGPRQRTFFIKIVGQ